LEDPLMGRFCKTHVKERTTEELRERQRFLSRCDREVPPSNGMKKELARIEAILARRGPKES
jgi:hypothetical protein